MNEEFRRTDLRPSELLVRARKLVADDYWLFFGMTAVAWILASCVPFKILLGPMMCGVFLTYRAKQAGHPIEFGHLWRGFDHFKESLIAALLELVLTFVAVSPFVALYMVGVFTFASGKQDGPPVALFGLMGLFYGALFVVILLVSAAFLFVFPLIIDRGATGIEAMTLSVRAARANAVGVLKVALVNGLATSLGALCCCVGAFFVFPLTWGMIWLAYREVFPAQEQPVHEDPLAGP